MKSIIKALVLSLSLLVLINCEPGEITGPDITFPVTLEKRLPVSAASTNEMTSTVSLDATSDPEIQKYLSKIKSYEITELLFGIENYSSPTDDEIYFNGTIGFSKISESKASSSCQVNNVPITNWANTADFSFGTCDDKLDDVSALIAVDNAAKIYLTGTFTNAPLSFDLKVLIKAKITANPL